MVKSIEGVYRDGKVELLEPAPLAGDARVIVTFLSVQDGVELASRGLDPARAGNLRSRLKAFADDWSRPEMDVYDAV